MCPHRHARAPGAIQGEPSGRSRRPSQRETLRAFLSYRLKAPAKAPGRECSILCLHPPHVTFPHVGAPSSRRVTSLPPRLQTWRAVRCLWTAAPVGLGWASLVEEPPRPECLTVGSAAAQPQWGNGHWLGREPAPLSLVQPGRGFGFSFIEQGHRLRDAEVPTSSWKTRASLVDVCLRHGEGLWERRWNTLL